MAPTYTISAADVSAVSTLIEGAIADWGAETITFPASVDQVTAQSIVNHLRFFEETEIGLARPPILADTAGKTQIGLDPDTSQPITTGVVAVLVDSWEIVTAKSSGSFIVRDVYRADGSVPYSNVSGVFIQYLTTIGGVISNTTSGSGLDAAQDTKLTDLHTRLTNTRAGYLDSIPTIATDANTAATNSTTLLTRWTDALAATLAKMGRRLGIGATARHTTTSITTTVDGTQVDSYTIENNGEKDSSVSEDV